MEGVFGAKGRGGGEIRLRALPACAVAVSSLSTMQLRHWRRDSARV